MTVTYLVFDAPKHGGKYEERVKHLQGLIDKTKSTTFAAVVGIQKCTGEAHLQKVPSLARPPTHACPPLSRYYRG